MIVFNKNSESISGLKSHIQYYQWLDEKIAINRHTVYKYELIYVY